MLCGLGDDGDAGHADRVHAHRLRLRARRHRRAAVREGDHAPADRAQQHRLHRVPQRLSKRLPVDLQFHFLTFLAWWFQRLVKLFTVRCHLFVVKEGGHRAGTSPASRPPSITSRRPGHGKSRGDASSACYNGV